MPKPHPQDPLEYDLARAFAYMSDVRLCLTQATCPPGDPLWCAVDKCQDALEALYDAVTKLSVRVDENRSSEESSK